MKPVLEPMVRTDKPDREFARGIRVADGEIAGNLLQIRQIAADIRSHVTNLHRNDQVILSLVQKCLRQIDGRLAQSRFGAIAMPKSDAGVVALLVETMALKLCL